MLQHQTATRVVQRASSTARPVYRTALPTSRPSSAGSQACISTHRRDLVKVRASEPEEQRAAAVEAGQAPTTSTAPAVEEKEEVVFFEGNGGSSAELALSLLLGLTLIYAPLTIASLGRRLWINIKITNKRIIIKNTSPLFKNEVQVALNRVKEVRGVPRGFGAWGDLVVFLRGGERLELAGLEKWKEIKEFIEREASWISDM